MTARKSNKPTRKKSARRAPAAKAGPTALAQRGWRIGFVVILLAAAGIQALSLTHPFVDRHDWGTAHQAQFARNHIRYGLAETRTQCVYSRHVIDGMSKARRTYPDHPPLLSLTLALSMWICGVNEVAVRLVPSLCTVAAVGLSMGIVAGLRGRRLALLTGLALLPLPILVYFGRLANHEPLTLAFALLALRGYLGWVEPERFGRRRRLSAVLFVAGTVLAILSGWAGSLYSGVIWLHFVVGLRGSPLKRSSAAWMLVTLPALLAALATFGHVLWALDWNLEHLYGLFVYRAGVRPDQAIYARSSLGGWLIRQGEWLWRDYSIAGLVLMAVGLFGWLRERRGADRIGRLSEAWLLAVPGLLFVVVFRSGSFEHDYWWLHVTPFVGLLIAFGLMVLARGAGRIAAPVAVLPVFAALGLMAAETASPWRRAYYQPGTLDSVYTACRYIAAQAPMDVTVYGNMPLWVQREYYAGPMAFLHPQAAWALDRKHRAVASQAGIRSIARRAPYYMFTPRGKEDNELGYFLFRNYRVRAAWKRAVVFDLTSPPATRPSVFEG